MLCESKLRAWLAYLGVAVAGFVICFVFMQNLPNMRNSDWVLIGIALGVPMLLAVPFLGYHLRIVVDRRDDVCCIQRRVFFIPICVRRLPLRGCRLIGSAIPVYFKHDKKAGELDPAGCLFFILGPFGTLIEAGRNLGRYEQRVRPASGLYHVDVQGAATPLFAMKSESVFYLVYIHDVGPDIVEPRFQNDQQLAGRYLATVNAGRK